MSLWIHFQRAGVVRYSISKLDSPPPQHTPRNYSSEQSCSLWCVCVCVCVVCFCVSPPPACVSAHFKGVLLVYPNSLHYYTNVTMCAGNLSKVYPRCTLIVYTSRLMCSSSHTWVQTVAMVILWKPVFAHSCAAGLASLLI